MIIGLTGPQRAGKTTVARILMQKHGAHFMSIGDMLKTAAHDLLGIYPKFPDEIKDEPHPALNGKTPRELYVHVGQLDEFQGDLWVKKMLRERFQGPDSFHVVESVGKQIQWQAIRKFAFVQRCPCVIWDVMRDGAEYMDNRGAIVDHRGMFHINNNGTHGELADNVTALFNKLKENPYPWFIEKEDVTL